ncbi:MAG: hypothetical protein PHI18_00105 [bacterium]|nr:hypothetical protein [bacterium]
MRSRLPLFLNSLTLEELLYLDQEVDRHTERYRRHYSVLAVQTDKPVLRAENAADLNRFARDVRRYVLASAAQGVGAVLRFSPEVSIVLFHSVADAAKGSAALLSALPELNGRYGNPTLRFAVKMGLATGLDTLAPGSPRSVRRSSLVPRASGLALRSAPNSLFMDDASYAEWPERHSVVPAPFDAEGQPVYRVIPGIFGSGKERYDNEALMTYLKQVAARDITTLKYNMERLPGSDGDYGDSKGSAVELTLEAYDPEQARNRVFKEKIDPRDFADRMDVIKRIVNSMGLAMVRLSQDVVGPEGSE